TFICHPELVSGSDKLCLPCVCHPELVSGPCSPQAPIAPVSRLVRFTCSVPSSPLATLRTPHTLLFFPPVQLKLLRSLRLRFAHNGGLERFRPSGFCLCK